MTQPLFTYSVKDTPWYIVVARGASHFYFDAENRTSVWQLADTGIEDLASRVNFDELAVLFAKSNGLRIGSSEVTRKKRKLSKSEVRSKRRGTENQQLISEVASNEARNEDNDEIDGSVDQLELPISLNVSLSLDEASESQENPVGLDLGYSSSESEKSESELEHHDEDGVNTGLDLAFASEDEEHVQENEERAKTEFAGLLDEFKDDISIYDPWFLAEEELLPRLSQNPSFYAVADSSVREKIFDEWVLARVSSGTKSSSVVSVKFPTQKLLFYQFLQAHKPAVRKLYFWEFCKHYPKQIEPFLAQTTKPNLENQYLELRVTLNDYAEYEKAAKKRKVDGNLKVAHIETFLRQKLTNVEAENVETAASGSEDASFFDRWMRLCNESALPARVVVDANNYVVGDEKRLACYLRVLGAVSAVAVPRKQRA